MLFGESHIQVNSMYYETGWENAAEWLDFCYLESNSTPTQVSTIRSDHEAEAYVYFYTAINLGLDVGPQVYCNIFYSPVEEYSNEKNDGA